MIAFPNCKLNLGLHIVGKREDGFHNLETVFYPLPLQEALEIIEAETPPSNDVTCTLSGLSTTLHKDDNICVKAFRLLKKDFPHLPPVSMHLHKVIPIGAGLGGGSSDGAFTLLLLNQKFNLKLTESQLIAYALQLGSDCPFFIKNRPCYATGRGELLEEIEVDLSPYRIVIVNPQIHINTGWAFSQLELQPHSFSLKRSIQQPVEQWKHNVTNDFEAPVFEKHPEIKSIKETLYNAGAVYAAMSGSGSTVYGLFLKDTKPTFYFPPHYYVKEVS